MYKAHDALDSYLASSPNPYIYPPPHATNLDIRTRVSPTLDIRTVLTCAFGVRQSMRFDLIGLIRVATASVPLLALGSILES